MKYDLIIKGGTVIDPSLNLSSVCDIAIADNKIAAISDTIKADATSTINAEGLVVTPGLIDFHTHLFYGGTDIGVMPDMAFLPLGVTTAVDTGSAGSANYSVFSSSIIANSIVRVKSYLNVCPAGLSTTKYHENVSPKYYDKKKMAAIIDKYSHEILGLKIRASKELVEDEGLEPLKKTIELAAEFGLPVAVHTTNPPEDAAEIAKLLRAGDIYVHMYQGTGSHIVGSDGKVKQAMKDAKERGVIFDASNGGNHWVFAVARAALADNFYPDIISTDITTKTLYKPPVYGLPYIMSKYLNMGMSLDSVVAACTCKPAQLMHMENKIGTLKPGAYADVALFKVAQRPTKFTDTKGEVVIGEQLLVPQATIKDGQLVYKSIEFAM